jgi:hypothetical protein
MYIILFHMVNLCADGWNHPGWVERKEILKENLGTVNELEEKLVAEIRGDRSCTLVRLCPIAPHVIS